MEWEAFEGQPRPLVCGSARKRQGRGEWEGGGGLNALSGRATASHWEKITRGSFLHVTSTEGDGEFSLSSL